MEFWIIEDWAENAVVIHKQDRVYTEKRLISPQGGIWHGPLTDEVQELVLARQPRLELVRNFVVCRS